MLHKKSLVSLTLFFFLVTVCLNPAWAQQSQSIVTDSSIQVLQNNLPVAYISEEESVRLLWEFQRRGYVVREGTSAQLAVLEQQVDKTIIKDKKDEKSEKTQAEDECIDCTSDEVKKGKQETSKPPPDPASETKPVPAPQPEQSPATVQTSVGVHTDLSFGSGRGNSSDVAKVLFIFAGVVVVAAFIVYAGKAIADLVKGKDHTFWWEFIFNSTFLSTDSGQHGRLLGVKAATGFVSSDLIQVALVGELGHVDLDLILNENTNPTNVDISGSYWLLGATARLHLTDKLVNASYLYMDFMGGTTSNDETGIIGMARLGASFGVTDYLRLGASLGAHYIGLDEDQGFANDGDNYWLTYGVEMGVRF